MSKELEAARELVRMLEEKERTGGAVPSNAVELGTLNAGAVFKIAEHDFIVLEQQEGQTAVISKAFMAEDILFGESKDYKTSNIKEVIERDIQAIIENVVGAENLVEHEVDLTSVDMQNEYASCRCKVRPITFDEARKYNDLLVNKELPDWWWTCTPWSTEERGWKYSMAVVSPSGDFNDNLYYCDGGVRPFCILKSNIFVSKGE